MIPYELIKEFVFMGVKFEYMSYDHKKCIEELRANPQITNTVSYGYQLPEDMWIIPDEIKKNNVVWRTGKLREVYFNNKGEMCRFKIGQRWYKNFILEDFGVTVKPRIYKSDDRQDLIGQGLAIEETN